MDLVDVWKLIDFSVVIIQSVLIVCVIGLYLTIHKMSVRKIKRWVSISVFFAMIFFLLSRVFRLYSGEAYDVGSVYSESMGWVFFGSLVLANAIKKKLLPIEYMAGFVMANTSFLIFNYIYPDIGRILLTFSNMAIIIVALVLSLKYSPRHTVFFSRIKVPIFLILFMGLIYVTLRSLAISFNADFQSLSSDEPGAVLFIFILSTMFDYSISTIIFTILIIVFSKSLFPSYITEKGTIYLVNEKKPLKGFEIFSNLTFFNYTGAAIIRTDPEKIRSSYMLDDIPFYWLSKAEDTGSMTGVSILEPVNLRKLVDTISDFCKSSKCPLILFEGMEYVINLNDFKIVMKVIADIKDVVIATDAVMIMPFNLSILDDKNASMLEREVVLLES